MKRDPVIFCEPASPNAKIRKSLKLNHAVLVTCDSPSYHSGGVEGYLADYRRNLPDNGNSGSQSLCRLDRGKRFHHAPQSLVGCRELVQQRATCLQNREDASIECALSFQVLKPGESHP